MNISIQCAMCGGKENLAIEMDTVDAETTLRDIVTRTGWIQQQNGSYFDIYCSERCAR